MPWSAKSTFFVDGFFFPCFLLRLSHEAPPLPYILKAFITARKFHNMSINDGMVRKFWIFDLPPYSYYASNSFKQKSSDG